MQITSFVAFIHGLSQGRHPWLRPGIWKVQCLLVFLSIVLLSILWTKFGACRKHKVPGHGQGWRTLRHCGVACIAVSIVDAMQISSLQLSYTAKIQCLLVFLSIVLLSILWAEFSAYRWHKVPGPGQGWRTLIHCGIAYIAGSIVDAMQITSFAIFIHGPLMDRHPWLGTGI